MAERDFTHLTPDEKINGIKASKLPDHIRSKYHGEDVREAIAQSTEMTIQLGINMGLSTDDAISWARKLQEAISRSEFDSWVATLLDGGPSIFMNTLAELRSTYPNGAPGVALVRETDPAKIYVWNGTAWEDFGDYQGLEIGVGEITSENIKKNSLTGLDMNFLTHKGNLLSLDNVVTGGYYNKAGHWNANSSYSTVIIYTGEGNHITNLGQYYEIAFWDKTGNSLVSNYISGNWSGTFVAPPNTYKLSLAFRPDLVSLLDKMVFKGNILPKEYVAYDEFTLSEKIKVSNLTDEIVTPKHTTFLEPSENLFDVSGIIEGGYYNRLGQWNTHASYRTIIIETDAGDYITNLGEHYEIAFWDETGSSVESSYTAGSWNGEIVAPTNSVKFSLAFRTTLDISQVMVVKGKSLPSTYIPNGQFTLSENIEVKTDVATAGKVGLYFGDSITETSTMDDSGGNYNSQFTTNWPTYMSELRLSAFKNYARSGATYRDQGDLTTNIRRNVRNQVNLALSNNEEADLIVVSLGTNDGTSYLGDYDTAMSKTSKSSLNTNLTIESARWTFWTLRENFPNAVMYCALPIQRASYEPPMELINGIRKMAERYNFIIIDATIESGIVRDFEVASGAGRYLRDGLHPNDTGKKLMGQLYSRVIAATFRE